MKISIFKFYCHQKTSLLLGMIFCFFFQILNARAEEVVLASEPLNIVTAVGKGLDIGDGQVATEAQLSNVRNPDFDSAGNLYIVDFTGHRIRKVDKTTKIITTVAGNGVQGSLGDDGPAAAAQISGPGGIAFDPAGNLYISEFFGNRIRMVTAHAPGQPIDGTETISTIAGTGSVCPLSTLPCGDGGPAKDALLSQPTGIEFRSGSLYIADELTHRVRKITAGTITAVAGIGTSCSPSTLPCGDGGQANLARLSNPSDVAFDSLGNLYITDTNNHCIRMVTAHTPGQPIDGTETISTVVGTMGVPSSNPSEPDGPATLAKIFLPRSIAVDSSDNSDGEEIYIGEFNGHRIRKVTAGFISTYAGTGIQGFNDDVLATEGQLAAPAGVAVDSLGDLYIADFSNTRIRKVDKTTKFISTVAGGGFLPLNDGFPATLGQLNSPRDAVVDSLGNIYVADFNNQRVRKVDVLTGEISTYAGNGTAGYSGDGDLATEAKLNGPWGLGVDAAGNLYIADSNNSCIRKVDVLTKKISTLAGSGTAGYGVRCSNNPSVPCTNNNQCGLGNTCSIGDNIPAESGKFNVPRGLAADPSGNIYIADVGNHRIRKISTSGIITTVAGNGFAGYLIDGVAATSTRINRPFDVEIDPLGVLYVADTTNHRLRMVVPGSDGVMDGLFDPDPEEIITTIAGNGVAGSLGDDGLATAAQLNSPGGVAATSSGIVYFSDSANSRIRKVKTGIITAAAGSNVGGFSGDGGPATEAQINLPRGLSLDSAENLYITDVGNSRIRRLNLATPVTIDPLEDPLERWVKATLRFPADWDPSDVALDTVTLQAVDPTDGSLRAIDTNGDGLLDQLLKAGLDSDAPVGPARERGPHKRWFRFEREEVASWASCGEDLDLRVEGRFADGRYFSGDTLIPVQSQNCTD